MVRPRDSGTGEVVMGRYILTHLRRGWSPYPPLPHTPQRGVIGLFTALRICGWRGFHNRWAVRLSFVFPRAGDRVGRRVWEICPKKRGDRVKDGLLMQESKKSVFVCTSDQLVRRNPRESGPETGLTDHSCMGTGVMTHSRGTDQAVAPTTRLALVGGGAGRVRMAPVMAATMSS